MSTNRNNTLILRRQNIRALTSNKLGVVAGGAGRASVTVSAF